MQSVGLVVGPARVAPDDQVVFGRLLRTVRIKKAAHYCLYSTIVADTGVKTDALAAPLWECMAARPVLPRAVSHTFLRDIYEHNLTHTLLLFLDRWLSEADVEGKIFLGGLTWQTTDDMLKTHFGKWGSLNDVILMRNKITGEPRGFGFVQYQDSTCEF